MRRWVFAAILLALVPHFAPLSAQSGYFGQNQVQFRQFRWQVLKTEHFDVHYYPELEEVARYTGQMAERSYERLRRVLNHDFRERKPILIYGSRNEFAQNNVIGDPGEGTGGVTDALRQRNMFFFTGDMREAERVLTHEMVHVFQYDIFGKGRAGGGMQQLAQNMPPLWFAEGMAEYLAIGPDHPHTDATLRDAALNGNIPSVEEMTYEPNRYFPYRFGQNFWQYVAGRWGDEIIGEIMNAVPSLGVERSFRRYTGTDLEELGEEWKEWVQSRYLPQVATLERPRRVATPLLNAKRTGGLIPVYIAPSLSPDGRKIAFISMGSLFRAEVFLDLYLADANTGEREVRLTKSQLDPEFEELRFGYSQGAFSPDGRFFAYTAQRGGKDVIYVHDVRRNRVVRRIDTPITSMVGPSFSPDGRRIVFSGLTQGYTDLYVVDLDGRNLQRLTNDVFGDLQPQWSPDGRMIAFASERGPQSDLETLRFGHWQINLYDFETNEISIIEGQGGKNINPQWAPDGRSLIYVSDRTGIAQLFLYDLDQREHYQLSSFVGGVSSLTEHSPAISWARQADKLAFTYADDGKFSIWSIVDPRALKREPFRATPTQVIAGGAPGAQADSLARAQAHADSVIEAASQPIPTRRRAVYLGDQGWRPGETLRPGAGGAVSVAALLDSAELALPDAATFTTERYTGRLRPEYVSRPSVGYAQDNFGRGVYGGTTIVLSDLLGNRRLAIAGGINGRVSEAQLFAQYLDLGGRQQWGAGLQHYPIFFLNGFNQQQSGNILFQEQAIARFIVRQANAFAQYPLNRFTRFEYGATFNNIDRSLMFISNAFDLSSGFSTGWYIDSIVNTASLNYVSPYVAWVTDNSLFGATGGIYGKRYRLQAEHTAGTASWTTFSADLRRYDALVFSFLTLANRAAANISIGPDEEQFPKYIGRPDFVRGYDREQFAGQACVGSGTDGSQCSAVQLLGSRVMYTNTELRFPLVRRFDLGIIPISLPPLDGLFFYDQGIAWSRGQNISFARPDNYNLDTDRFLLRSYGFGLRLNLFNLALVRWDYSIPLDGDNRKPYWFWTLGQSF